MNRSDWRAAGWLVPLVVALVVFAGVLATTPPGFGAIAEVAFGQARGARAEAAAYALGAASSLALLSLAIAAALFAVINEVVRRFGR